MTLAGLQAQGLVGHWEISIPADDDGEVVTVAVDDDISIPAQVLLREQKMISISPVQAAVVAACAKSGIKSRMDAYFLDPSTTAQEVYNPSQVLLSMSEIRDT